MVNVTVNEGLSWETNLPDIPEDEWEAVLGYYKSFCQRSIRRDCRHILRIIKSARDVDWAGYGSQEHFIKAALDLDPQATAWAVKGLEIVGLEVPVPFSAAQEVGRREETAALAGPAGPPPIGEHGGDRRSDQDDNIILKKKQGTSAIYLSGRVKRDAPDVAARQAAGEFGSVQEAIREAERQGKIIRRPRKAKLQTPAQRLEAIEADLRGLSLKYGEADVRTVAKKIWP